MNGKITCDWCDVQFHLLKTKDKWLTKSYIKVFNDKRVPMVLSLIYDKYQLNYICWSLR